MQKINVPKQSVFYAPTFERGNLKTISAPLSHGNAIKMFCTTIKGERPLLTNWGLPEIIHKPEIDSSEIEAIILSNLKQFFPDGEYLIECTNLGLGEKVCRITYQYDSVKDTLVITF